MFIIPMAGLSSRFFKSGYNLPKYQLTLPNNETMFEWAVDSFKAYFETDLFLFIVRNVYDTPTFVKNMCNKLGIIDFKIVILEGETRGQAETVYLGLKELKNILSEEEIYIFNIDSRRLNFVKSEISYNCDGYLEVFKGEGDHWSFIEINCKNEVIRTTEKERISELCSDGLYFFKSLHEYIQLVEIGIKENLFCKEELYIAPLYNLMIRNGKKVSYDLIDEKYIEFCGTPAEFENISKKILG
ncbi:glycosyltransferase family 2 protein [Acinetobacter variabilis]|uniref:glycosyltransferase family 2 protein n=1 Tax=Acinetobacter variabilis TaxID=70346 RepID=UPI002671265D|nr:glycosyltransferase family 2 protein [Acinetobacter variabilis]WKT72796.1 glycosyltransferase family 2 protein [Acinetobacter variabilis]